MSAAEWDQVHERRSSEWLKRSIEGFEPDPRVRKIADQHTAPESLDPSKITKWLDVGCGIALTTEWIARRRNFVWGFDGSHHALAIALYRLTGAPFTPWPRLIHADAEKPWPYAAGMFDVVLDVRCLENLDDNGAVDAYTQAERVLKPGGMFYSITASPKRDDRLTTIGIVRKPTDEQILENLNAASLKIVSLWDSEVIESGRSVHDWIIAAQKPA